MRDATGALLAVGSTVTLHPNLIPDGGIAFGRVTYDGLDSAPEGATVEFAVTPGPAEAADGTPGNNQLVINELASTGDRFIGTVTNMAAGPAIYSFIAIACLDDAGTITAAAFGGATQSRIAPGTLGTFSIPTTVSNCDRYVIAADA